MYNVGGVGTFQYDDWGRATVTNCTFVGNKGTSGGAGIGGMNFTVTNCIFLRNNALSGGGAHIGNSTVTNSIFVANTANKGGGMQMCFTTYDVSVRNCTFTCNWANEGGGIFCDDGAGKVVSNCILWGNRVGGDANESAQIDGGTPVIDYSCIQGWSGSLGGSHNSGSDPLFVREPNDGNDGWDVGNNDDFGDLRLLGGSPYIDAGDNYRVSQDIVDLDGDGVFHELIPWDIQGFMRFQDDPLTTDTGNGAPPIVDIGAYEGGGHMCGDAFHPLLAGDVNRDCKLDFRDIAIVGASWLQCTHPDCD